MLKEVLHLGIRDELGDLADGNRLSLSSVSKELLQSVSQHTWSRRVKRPIWG